MKTKILKIASVVFTVSTILTGCNTPAEKVEKAEINVSEANKELSTAQEEYVADIENYRKETGQLCAWEAETMGQLPALHHRPDLVSKPTNLIPLQSMRIWPISPVNFLRELGYLTKISKVA